MSKHPAFTRDRHLLLTRLIREHDVESVLSLLHTGLAGSDVEFDAAGGRFVPVELLAPYEGLNMDLIHGHQYVTEGRLLMEGLTTAVKEGLGHLWPHFHNAGADFSDSFALMRALLRYPSDLCHLKAMTKAGLLCPRLNDAINADSLSGVRWLLSCGASMEERDEYGRTALFEAIPPCRLRRLSVWNALLDAGADIQVRDNAGITPLHFCARMRHHRQMRRLIELGANVSERCDAGLTPLLECFCVIDSYSVGGKMPPAATYATLPTCVRMLILAGSDPNETTPSRESGLHLAAWGAHAALIRTLLKMGFDPSLRNSARETPLDIAIRQNNGAAFAVLDRVSPAPFLPLEEVDWGVLPECRTGTPVLSTLRRPASFWKRLLANAKLSTAQLASLPANPSFPKNLHPFVNLAVA